MKLLLCINRRSDFQPLFDSIAKSREHPTITFPEPTSSNFIFSFHYLQHEIDVCETGYGLFQTTFKVTKALAQKKYHLALKVAFCNAYNPDLNIGDMVNVIKDKPGDMGQLTPVLTAEEGDTAFADLYDLGLIDKESFPHFKGAFINMNNSYMNVLMPYKKVVSVTVNNYADSNSYEARRNKYKADIETGDGLGFVYPCMYERQPFYQLNVIERKLASGEYDFEKAKASLNETLFDILQKL